MPGSFLGACLLHTMPFEIDVDIRVYRWRARSSWRVGRMQGAYIWQSCVQPPDSKVLSTQRVTPSETSDSVCHNHPCVIGTNTPKASVRPPAFFPPQLLLRRGNNCYSSVLVLALGVCQPQTWRNPCQRLSPQFPSAWPSSDSRSQYDIHLTNIKLSQIFCARPAEVMRKGAEHRKMREAQSLPSKELPVWKGRHCVRTSRSHSGQERHNINGFGVQGKKSQPECGCSPGVSHFLAGAAWWQVQSHMSWRRKPRWPHLQGFAFTLIQIRRGQKEELKAALPWHTKSQKITCGRQDRNTIWEYLGDSRRPIVWTAISVRRLWGLKVRSLWQHAIS